MNIFTSPKYPQNTPKIPPKYPHFLASRFFVIFLKKVGFFQNVNAEIFFDFIKVGFFQNVNAEIFFDFIKVGFFQNVKYKKIELKNTKKGLLSPIFKIFSSLGKFRFQL